MSIIGWIILGLIAGFIASKIVNKTGMGFFMDLFLGIVGAIVGGVIFSALGASGITGLNLYSMVVTGWQPCQTIDVRFSSAARRTCSRRRPRKSARRHWTRRADPAGCTARSASLTQSVAGRTFWRPQRLVAKLSARRSR